MGIKLLLPSPFSYLEIRLDDLVGSLGLLIVFGVASLGVRL